jgi:hypothetical protein
MSAQQLPKTFKAAQVKKAGSDPELVDVPLVLPKQGDVLVKVLACGVCRGDLMAKSGHVPLPLIPGHEIIGDVVAVHDSETQVIGFLWDSYSVSFNLTIYLYFSSGKSVTVSDLDGTVDIATNVIIVDAATSSRATRHASTALQQTEALPSTLSCAQTRFCLYPKTWIPPKLLPSFAQA